MRQSGEAQSEEWGGYLRSGEDLPLTRLVCRVETGPLHVRRVDRQGGEVYYNAEITPWFHLTADLQVIQPALESDDAAVVFGLRGKIDL